MKQWVQKLIEQLDYDWGKPTQKSSSGKPKLKLSEDRATLLYFLDTYNKHLIDIDTYPVRKVREMLDGFTRELVTADKDQVDDILFRLRQFFSSYRVAEYAYLRKTFDDFKGIIWNFVEHMSEDFKDEQAADKEIYANLQQLKDAVESDSIPMLRAKSREFIEFYATHHTKRDERRTKRMRGIKKNLDAVKKQLVEADRSMRLDHLTGAFNRRSFDEYLKQQVQLFTLSKTQVSLIIIDIDFFKKINDTYGHDIGDFILKECVQLLQSVFSHEGEFVARIGGEEFGVILPNHAVEHAVKRAEACLDQIRKEVFITQDKELRFTSSMGIAQLLDGESTAEWLKRADEALYASKHGGRNRYTVASHPERLEKVA